MEPGESLPKIAQAGLSFPDLEEVPAIKPKEEKKKSIPKKPKLSMAKKRFNQMAFSVLAKIIDEKTQGDEESEEEEGEGEVKVADAPVEGGERQEESSNELNLPKPNASSTSPRRPSAGGNLSRHGSASSLATVDSSAGGPKKKKKKGPSFMSVLRLASYRKRMGGKGLLGRKGANSVASSLGELDEDDEHISELPSQPRFCATLSTEAQYAMLKCYEDVLLDSIRNGKPKEPVPDDATLFRVKTPHDGFRSLHLAGPKDMARMQLPQLGEDPPTVVDTTDGTVTTTDKPGAGSKPPSRESAKRVGSSSMSRGGFRLPSIGPHHGAAAHHHRLSSSSTSSLLPGGRLAVPRDKQLRLSYRFQTAMDILDAVRDSNGELITSPRAVKLAEINPLRNYNRWSKGWSKEFKHEYGGANSHNNGGMKT